MENSEEAIRLHNPSFYESILPWIQNIPDFRPQETLKAMAKRNQKGEFIIEPQNNWQTIFHELESIGYNNYHTDILNMINSGDPKELTRYIEDREGMTEFIFSYPVLVWLMLKISPRDTIVPIIISQGEYFNQVPLSQGKFLDEIKLTRKDIGFIRDIETGKYLRTKYNNLIRSGEIEALLDDDSPSLSEAIKKLGYIYWFVAPDLNKQITKNMMAYISISKDLNLLTLLFKSKSLDGQYLQDILSYVMNLLFDEGLNFFLQEFTFDEELMFDMIHTSIYQMSVPITKMLLDSLPNNFSFKNIYILTHIKSALFHKIMDNLTAEIIELLVQYSFMEQILEELLDDRINEILTFWDKRIINILTIFIKRDIVNLSDDNKNDIATKGSKELIEVFLEKENTFNNYYINAALRVNNMETFEPLLLHGDLDTEDINRILNYAIDRRMITALSIIVKYPNIEKIANINLLNKANKLLSIS